MRKNKFGKWNGFGQDNYPTNFKISMSAKYNAKLINNINIREYISRESCQRKIK
jgi:hypothetical protein